MTASKLPFRWSTLFAVFGLLPINALVFLSPTAVAVALTSVDTIKAMHQGGTILLAICLLSLTVPAWLLGLTIAVVRAPPEIRDHKNITMYLERLNKAASADDWHKLMGVKVREWNSSDCDHNVVSRIIVSILVSLTLANCVGTSVLFLAAAFPTLLG